LLLHSDEDPLEPLITIEDQSVAHKLGERRFVTHAVFDDRDWSVMQPILSKQLKADIRPWQSDPGSWHFYRHSFAAWNLSGWEALQAVAMAGKEKVTVRMRKGTLLSRAEVVFEGDVRVLSKPKVDALRR
jgi:hypothetical protein